MIMTGFEEKMRLAKVLLRQIEEEPLRWTELMKNTLRHCGTPGRYRSILNFLLKESHVVKIKEGRKAWIKITEKGLKLLKAIE